MNLVPLSRLAALTAAGILMLPAAAVARTHPRLRWSPPKLYHPTTIVIGRDGLNVALDPARDYVIRIRHVDHINGVVLNGGHNIVIVGGEISIPWAGARPRVGGGDRRGLMIQGATGVVHVEGLLIDGPDVSEGIQINSPKAVVQIENVRIVRIHARDEVHWTDNHPDLVQPWGGVRLLRIDRLSGSSDCQGLELSGPLGPIGSVDVRHVDIVGLPTARVLLWIQAPVRLAQVWIRPSAGRSIRASVWPPDTPKLRFVHVGRPPHGSFVGHKVAGVRYRSPGYVR
jgi:hypothetical protein